MDQNVLLSIDNAYTAVRLKDLNMYVVYRHIYMFTCLQFKYNQIRMYQTRVLMLCNRPVPSSLCACTAPIV